eukprot:TRINITY_DN20597_c0_g1_i1.p1 TRINITY_DN20597_c0_g1~~TRINITY_DN20597_c0_g1_i1.p1  ORF type:complete len:386 (+),score=66.55 TRINITY_DN20597_c0_g1_i1:70-1227(+)
MVGCNAINIRYTREKNIAFILNEMLLHLLKAHPPNAVDSLVKYLENADMQMLLKGGKPTRRLSEKKTPVPKEDEAKQQEPEKKEPAAAPPIESPREEQTRLENQRGDGLMMLNATEFREIFRVLAYMQAMPAPAQSSQEYTPSPVVVEDKPKNQQGTAEGDGLITLSNACGSDTHPGIQVLTASRRAATGPVASHCDRKGAGIELLKTTGGDNSCGLKILIAAAAAPAFIERSGLGIEILQQASSEAAEGIRLLIEAASLQQGDGLKALRRASTGQIGVQMLSETAEAPPIVEKTVTACGLKLLRESSGSQTLEGLSILFACAEGSSDGLTLLERSGSACVSALRDAKVANSSPAGCLSLLVSLKAESEYEPKGIQLLCMASCSN